MTRLFTFSASVAAIVASGAGVLAAPSAKKQQSAVPKVLGNFVRATGLAAALGGATAAEVQPAWQSTQADLRSLLTYPCEGGAPAGEARCPMESRFQQWAMDLHKPYVGRAVLQDADGDQEVVIAPSAGYEAEYEDRFRKFADNVAAATDFNEDSKGQATYGITKFADMDEAEFMKQRGGMVVDAAQLAEMKKLPKATIGSSSNFLAEGLKTEGSKDWSAEGFTTAIKDQGMCGSCWAFSTTEQVESMAIKQGIKDGDDPYVLSPQELVSCDHNGDMGCGGGLPIHALKWLEKKGLERESDYPYKSGVTMKSGKCHRKKAKGVIEVDSYTMVSAGAEQEDDLKKYVLNEGPVSIGVDANRKWQLYKGGVMKASDCEGPLDHAVQVVGIDTDEGTWKVRNSWNADWGEDGYIRLALDTNTCGLANMAVTTKVKKVGGEELIV